MCLSDDLAYEVKWFFTRLRGGPASVQVASVDRFGVVRKINRNSSSDVTIERKDTHTYLLNIFGTQDRWGANEWFVCLIPFWLRDLHNHHDRHHNNLCPLWFPVTVGSISAPSLPGTCRPQREPGQKLKSWHHPKSSSLSNLQVWCKRHAVTL